MNFSVQQFRALMQVNKLSSPRRAVKDKQHEHQHSHTIDFSVFRRKDSQIASQSVDSGIIVQRGCGMAAILGGLNILHYKQQAEQHLFKELEVTNTARQYESYLHEKTLLQFLRIFKQKFTSITVLIDIVNHYPIAVFFLQLYARQSALVYLQEATQSQNSLMMGNQFQLLADMKSDLRGNSLDILAKGLRLSLTVKYPRVDSAKFIRKSSIQDGEESEVYGGEDYCAAIQLKRSCKELVFNVIEHKANFTSSIRKSKIELLQRKSRVRQPEGRNGIESKSIYKEKACLECGMSRCSCKEKDLSGLASSTNFSKSTAGGFAQYGCKVEENTGISSASKLSSFGMGFINMSKIVNRQAGRKA